MRRGWAAGTAALCLILLGGAAGPAQMAVDARKAGFKALGGSFKSVNDLLRANDPDRASLARKVREVGVAARRLPHWFPSGSGPSAGISTRTKDKVWSDAAAFRTVAVAMVTEADKLGMFVRKGDMDAAREQARTLGQTCAGCHSRFRAKD